MLVSRPTQTAVPGEGDRFRSQSLIGLLRNWQSVYAGIGDRLRPVPTTAPINVAKHHVDGRNRYRLVSWMVHAQTVEARLGKIKLPTDQRIDELLQGNRNLSDQQPIVIKGLIKGLRTGDSGFTGEGDGGCELASTNYSVPMEVVEALKSILAESGYQVSDSSWAIRGNPYTNSTQLKFVPAGREGFILSYEENQVGGKTVTSFRSKRSNLPEK